MQDRAGSGNQDSGDTTVNIEAETVTAAAPVLMETAVTVPANGAFNGQ